MKHALALILAGGTLGLAQSATANTLPPAANPAANAPVADAPRAAPLQPILVDGDDDDWFWSNGDRSGTDDSNGGGSGTDDCNWYDDDLCRASNAAPAGTVAPPQNGLFTDGTAPVVKSN